MTDSVAPATPAIYRLPIGRFRGIKSLTWLTVTLPRSNGLMPLIGHMEGRRHSHARQP